MHKIDNTAPHFFITHNNVLFAGRCLQRIFKSLRQVGRSENVNKRTGE